MLVLVRDRRIYVNRNCIDPGAHQVAESMHHRKAPNRGFPGVDRDRSMAILLEELHRLISVPNGITACPNDRNNFHGLSLKKTLKFL
jgi:hypothetical protein